MFKVGDEVAELGGDNDIYTIQKTLKINGADYVLLKEWENSHPTKDGTPFSVVYFKLLTPLDKLL